MSPPASSGSPTGPALRANPSPEVTDPFCRLPLPTLFYRPEAVHLGDLLRISVRPGTRVTEALPRIFKGRRQRTGRHLKCGARPSRGAYLRPTRFQARGSSRRKDNSSRDCRRRLRVRSRCRHRPRPTPCSGSGMLTRFPVAGWRPRPPSNRPTSGRPVALGWFSRRLGSTNPCPTAVHTEPFPTSAFKVLP